jgi:hypothetical protein
MTYGDKGPFIGIEVGVDKWNHYDIILIFS